MQPASLALDFHRCISDADGLLLLFAGAGTAGEEELLDKAREVQVSHLLIYQAPACSTDPLTILTAVQEKVGRAEERPRGRGVRLFEERGDAADGGDLRELYPSRVGAP